MSSLRWLLPSAQRSRRSRTSEAPAGVGWSMCRLVPGKLWVRVSEREDAAAWGVAPSGLTEGRTCMGWVVRGGGLPASGLPSQTPCPAGTSEDSDCSQ